MRRRLATARNAIIHGDLEMIVSRTEIEKFIEILEHLLGPVSQEAA